MLAREFDEIVAERERIWGLVVGVSNGGAVARSEPARDLFDAAVTDTDVA